jgi:XisI protein
MDRLAHYRQCIETILADHAALSPSDSGVDVQIVADREHDHC